MKLQGFHVRDVETIARPTRLVTEALLPVGMFGEQVSHARHAQRRGVERAEHDGEKDANELFVAHAFAVLCLAQATEEILAAVLPPFGDQLQKRGAEGLETLLRAPELGTHSRVATESH